LKEQAIAFAKQQLAANGVNLAQVDIILAEQSTPNPFIQKLKEQAIALAKKQLAANGITLAQVTNFNSLVMDQVDNILAEQGNPLV
jgi:stage V sporulation protein SpoVS